MLQCLSQCFGWSERGGPSLQNGLRPVCADGVMGFKTHISCAGMLELCPLSCSTHELLLYYVLMSVRFCLFGQIKSRSSVSISL